MPALADLLDVYRWKARPVLVFAPELGDPEMSEMVSRFKDATQAISERDVVVLLVTGNSGDPFVRYGPSELKFMPPDRGPDNAALRKAYSVPTDQFAVILVGKDGGEKNRWTSPVAPSVIFDRIDSMPMRRQEMGGTG